MGGIFINEGGNYPRKHEYSIKEALGSTDPDKEKRIMMGKEWRRWKESSGFIYVQRGNMLWMTLQERVTERESRLPSAASHK